MPVVASTRAVSAACLLLTWGVLLLPPQHPDASGEWQASTLGIAYDWSSGDLSSHRYSWQKVTEPVEVPPEDISRVTVRAVTPPQRNR